MATRRLQLAALLLSALGLFLFGIGCSGNDTNPLGTTSSGTGGTGTGGGGQGGDGAGQTGGNGTGGSMPEGVGMVLGMSGTYASFTTSSVIAFFAPITGGTSTCTTTNDGDCIISDCDLAAGGAGGAGGSGGAGGASVAPNAGAVHVTGGVRDVDLVPEPDGTYTTNMSTNQELFTDGQTITIAADGNDIAAFSEDLTAPSLIAVTAPDFSSGTVAVPTDSDLTVSWTAGNNGDVVVSLSGSDANSSVSVSCTYAATDGSGTVPASALSSLQGLSNGGISVSAASTVMITPSDWQVILSLSSVGTAAGSPSGMASGLPAYQ